MFKKKEIECHSMRNKCLLQVDLTVKSCKTTFKYTYTYVYVYILLIHGKIRLYVKDEELERIMVRRMALACNLKSCE